eukprot:TRINITY_DN6657_c0_g3_i3.p1 TRINITY_DN6657_c0_g3~~TRINITY_DN6657_c0_g3_i3.p1  ORF type:complete len:806 (+),score=186.38 TRINITY_DN6657_c0_g3_i3:256-2673(+)
MSESSRLNEARPKDVLPSTTTLAVSMRTNSSIPQTTPTPFPIGNTTKDITQTIYPRALNKVSSQNNRPMAREAHFIPRGPPKKYYSPIPYPLVRSDQPGPPNFLPRDATLHNIAIPPPAQTQSHILPNNSVANSALSKKIPIIDPNTGVEIGFHNESAVSSFSSAPTIKPLPCTKPVPIQVFSSSTTLSKPPVNNRVLPIANSMNTKKEEVGLCSKGTATKCSAASATRARTLTSITTALLSTEERLKEEKTKEYRKDEREKRGIQRVKKINDKNDFNETEKPFDFSDSDDPSSSVILWQAINGIGQPQHTPSSSTSTSTTLSVASISPLSAISSLPTTPLNFTNDKQGKEKQEQTHHKSAPVQSVWQSNPVQNQILEKVKVILDNITPTKHKGPFRSMLKIDFTSLETLKSAALLIYDKAIEKPEYIHLYATLCKKITENFTIVSRTSEFPILNPEGIFKRALLEKCQEEFELNLRKIKEKEVPTGLPPWEIASWVESRPYVQKQMIGNVKFIGELYKQDVIEERVVNICLHELFDEENLRDAVIVEALCVLFTLVGPKIDNAKSRERVDQYFETFKALSAAPTLTPHVHSELEKLINLRKNKWEQEQLPIAGPTEPKLKIANRSKKPPLTNNNSLEAISVFLSPEKTVSLKPKQNTTTTTVTTTTSKVTTTPQTQTNLYSQQEIIMQALELGFSMIEINRSVNALNEKNRPLTLENLVDSISSENERIKTAKKIITPTLSTSPPKQEQKPTIAQPKQKQEKGESEEKEEDLCVICFTEKINSVSLLCGHMALCFGCEQSEYKR